MLAFPESPPEEEIDPVARLQRRRRFGDFFYRKIGDCRTQALIAGLKWLDGAMAPSSQRILFSQRPDLEPPIRQGFESGPHRISFGEFTPESIAAHDLVVPLSIADILRLDGMRNLVAGNPIPIPSRESVSTCDDKAAFRRTLIELGFGDYLPDSRQESDFPYMLKKRVDEWGKSCRIIRDRDDERTHGALLSHPEYLTQQLIPGRDEYATHVVFRGGKIIAALNLRYRFMSDAAIKGRDRTLSIHPCRFAHRGLFEEILQGIGFEGLCCFNYKMQRGKPKIMEINPRFGGSLGPFFFSFIRKVVR